MEWLEPHVRRQRPIALGYGCIVAMTIGGLATLLPIAAALLPPAHQGERALSELGMALFAAALDHALAIGAPVGLLGLALLACAIAAMRGSRTGWAGATILLSLFAIALLFFAIVGDLIVLSVATVAAVVCLLTPAARRWYERPRRVTFEVVRRT